MADTIKTRDQILGDFPNQTSGAITPQDARDFIVSSFGFFTGGMPSVNNDRNDTAGVGAKFDAGSYWIDTANHQPWFCIDGTPGAARWVSWPGPTPPPSYPITVDKGGTGLTAVGDGQLVAGLNATQLQVVATGLTGYVLTSQGAGNVPSWSPPFTLPVPITVPGGGTGLVTVPAHNLLVGAGTAALVPLAPGAAGTFLQSQGAGADPAWSNVLTTFLAFNPVTYVLTTGTPTLASGDVWIIVTSSSSITLRGFGGTLTGGRQLIISNGNAVGSGNNVTLASEDAGATANQRIHTPDAKDCILLPDESAVLQYDALVLNRWWEISKIFDVTGARGVRTATAAVDMQTTELWHDEPAAFASGNHVFATDDRGGTFCYTGGAAQTWSVPAATPGTGTLFPKGWSVDIYNVGSGPLSLTPAGGTINGLGTWTVQQFHGGSLSTDGTNWVFTDIGTAANPPSGSPISVPMKKYFTAEANSNSDVTLGLVTGALGHSANGIDDLGTWDQCQANTATINYGWVAGGTPTKMDNGLRALMCFQLPSNLGNNLGTALAHFAYVGNVAFAVGSNVVPTGWGIGVCRRSTDTNWQFLTFNTGDVGGGSTFTDSGIAEAEGVRYYVLVDCATKGPSNPIISIQGSDGSFASNLPVNNLPPAGKTLTGFYCYASNNGTSGSTLRKFWVSFVSYWLDG